jgi:5-formyltetrahydrofolate cyclo-ligase
MNDSSVSISASDLMNAKGLMRRKAYDARNDQPDKDTVSQAAVTRLMELSEYRQAKTVLWYLDCRSELRTRYVLPEALATSKRIIIPYCTLDDAGSNKLGLWALASMDELAVGKWKILEPPRARWGEPGKEVEPSELDLVIVPGVAFSRRGGRMGNGQGYYDRLLAQVRVDCALIGLCYESQLFDELTVGPHDVFMDKVVTESTVYMGQGRTIGG